MNQWEKIFFDALHITKDVIKMADMIEEKRQRNTLHSLRSLVQ